MPKIIPVVGIAGRHTGAGTIELKLSGIDGKTIEIAVMPSFADKFREVVERLRGLRGEPDTTAIEVLSGAQRKALRAMAAGEPLRSGGFRVAADPERGAIHLQVAQSDGTAAEIPLDETLARRLVEHLGSALAAIRPPTGRH